MLTDQHTAILPGKHLAGLQTGSHSNNKLMNGEIETINTRCLKLQFRSEKHN